MSAPARLLALRLQGFKSFAERTIVEFSPGISAIVGPNGSGKSNLADALRWALGEQGRSLRSRKSEDVIFAGSDRRAAVGMADVTIVLDNADRLLPVEYSVVELGRRLYRSGENDYLLNRQRVRLKDLVDLLDAAALADNAFLFIGQGMVDQALALRPEERRPLFEDVAGVRRHDRRRRKAEEQLAEAEDNLARVEDIIGELKPQARRLAAQAEQQVTRASAGDELAEALVVAAHARWFEASQRLAAAASRLSEGRVDTDLAMRLLTEAEGAAADISGGLAARAEVAEAGRRRHEEARAELTGLQLRSERLAADLAGIERDRSRLSEERVAAEAALALQRTEPAEALPELDHRLEASTAEAERALSEASAELAALRGAMGGRTDAAATLRRAQAARADELDSARRRLAETTRRAADLRGQADVGLARAADLAARLEATRRGVAEAGDAGLRTSAQREVARTEVEEAEARQRVSEDGLSEVIARASVVRGRRDELRARLAEEEARGIAKAARRVGGRRVDEELHVEPRLRAAVDAALGPIARAYLIAPEALADLASERGVVVPAASDGAAMRSAPGDGSGRRGSASDAAEERFRARVRARGGGPLAEAIRRDGIGAAQGLLARTAWLPDRAALVDLWPELPAGWVIVSLDGATVATGQAMWLGRGETPLEERAELERVSAQLDRLEDEVTNAQRTADEAKASAVDARSRLTAIRAEDTRAAADLRTAEEVERAAGRDAERAAREASWQVGQADQVDAERGRLRELVSGLEAELDGQPDRAARPHSDGQAAAIDVWEARIAELRARRDRLGAERAEHERQRRDAEASLARATVSREYAVRQLERTAEELVRLTAKEAELRSERDRLGASMADATAHEERDRLASEALRASDSVDRQRLRAAEADGAAARERLRRADEQLRAAEVADLEARLGLDAIREGILVELAGIGEAGLHTLQGISGTASPGADGAGEPDGRAVDDHDLEPDGEQAELEAALEAVLPSWGSDRPFAEAPTPGRLAALRRRFHELGQANPFAVDEFAELKVRLEALETQADDLRSAIAQTRRLIDELSTMIADQFQSTFRALEAAFETRFRQLFGGGYARLELTDPGDLSGTGVEIVARPPGKKAQALAMLSGGERALTAVALLFAMLQVRPVPFCVLDEVDAALDEANVGRFAEALASLAEATQFIVITHNRGTIEAADALYGVTVGDDSVSRIISLRLDEATAIAAREADNRAVTLEPAAS